MIASIPSPPQGVWYLGPVPVRAYALAIMLGIVVAIWLGERRWVARGGRAGDVLDIAIWAVPSGIIGARLYHVITDWDRYFGESGDPIDALQIWTGGLSIFGAIAGGVLGGYIGARRKGIPFPALADALAPGIVLAQAIGRWGNYFNQELFGRPTDVPWALEIDERNRPAGYEQFETFHPTFLYESLWAVAIALILIAADKRFKMGHGRVFALYVALYTAGRVAVESLRIDTGGSVEGPAREFLGMRINAWVSVALLVGAVLYIVISARLRPGRETIELPSLDAEADATADNAKAAADNAKAAADKAEAEASADEASEAGDTAVTKVDESATAAGDAAEIDAGDTAEAGDAADTDADDTAAAEPEVRAEAEPEVRAEADADQPAASEAEQPAASEAEDVASADDDADTGAAAGAAGNTVDTERADARTAGGAKAAATGSDGTQGD